MLRLSLLKSFPTEYFLVYVIKIFLWATFNTFNRTPELFFATSWLFKRSVGGNQPLVASKTPKIKFKFRNFFESNMVEISLSWHQRFQKSNWKSEIFSSPTRWKSASRGVKDSKNQIENPTFFLVQHGGNQPPVAS